MDNNVIISEANYYLNHDLTVAQVAIELGISKRSLQLHFKELEKIDLYLYNLVREKQNRNMEKGRILGGMNGKVSPRYSSEDALKIAKTIIKDELTYQDAEDIFGIPKSTIYEMVHSSYIPVEVKAMLEVVALANTKGVLVSDLRRKG